MILCCSFGTVLVRCAAASWSQRRELASQESAPSDGSQTRDKRRIVLPSLLCDQLGTVAQWTLRGDEGSGRSNEPHIVRRRKPVTEKAAQNPNMIFLFSAHQRNATVSLLGSKTHFVSVCLSVYLSVCLSFFPRFPN